MSVSATGSVWYSPDSNYVGPDSLSYVVSDTSGAVSNVAWVLLNVVGVNDAPVAVNDALSVVEGGSGFVVVLTNDSDVDGLLDVSTVSLISGPLYGSVSIAPSGIVTYQALGDYSGPDSFSYVVSDDGGLASNIAWVIVDVLELNDGPVAVNDYGVVYEDSVNELGILGNDYDLDGLIDSSCVSVSFGVSQGSLSVDANGIAWYTPAADYVGLDSFGYQVCDDSGLVSNLAVVILNVQDVNDAPVGVADVASLPMRRVAWRSLSLTMTMTVMTVCCG